MFLEILRTVWQSFRANRMRFALTLMGVTIGCGSLVLLSGLLEGGKEALLLASQQAAEDDLIEIRSSSPPRKDQRRTTRPLAQPDVAALDQSPLLEDAEVTSMREANQTVFWKGKGHFHNIIGASPDALGMCRLSVARGRFISDDDLRARRKVAVIGFK